MSSMADYSRAVSALARIWLRFPGDISSFPKLQPDGHYIWQPPLGNHPQSN